MKYLLVLLLSFNLLAVNKKLRAKIGPTVAAPIEYKGKLYFLATTGNLYESDYKLDKIKSIFNTKNSSVTELTLDGELVYFGEGLHDTTKANFYIYNLKKKKIEKTISLQGHIQRAAAFDKESIFIGHGPGGISSINKKSFKINWTLSKIAGKKIHIDSKPIIIGENVCFNSIYTTKAIICVNKKTQKIVSRHDFKVSPKMENLEIGKYIVGATTKADMLKSKFDIPSMLYFFNKETLKVEHTKELRGYNFFSPKAMNENEFLITLSTGDILTYNIPNKKITFVGEFPEPFISTPFMKETDLCAIGIMGQLLCFEKGKTRYHITTKKRYFESPIGIIKKIKGKHFIPSRVGYFII